MFLDPIKLG